jgi:hypothetical protein
VKAGRAPSRALAACLCIVAAPLTAQAQAAAHAAPLPPLGAHDILVMLRMAPEHARPNVVYSGNYDDPSLRGVRRQAQQIAERHRLQLLHDGWPMPLLAVDCFVMRVSDDRSAEAAAADIAHEPLVAWSQPVNAFASRGGHDRPPLARPAHD